ncbi:MAG: hypothetical protein QXQ69_01040 [Candidatus Aenigmatarchaeota archaeon]
MSAVLQALSILLLFLGEALAIYSEIAGANKVLNENKISSETFLWFFLLITIAGLPLIAGYFLGIIAFKNIWIVSVVSIVSILIVEPILAYLIFKQFPTYGALIGLILGSVGLIITLVVK